MREMTPAGLTKRHHHPAASPTRQHRTRGAAPGLFIAPSPIHSGANGVTEVERGVASPRNASLTSRQAVPTNVCRYKKRQGQISVLHPRLPPESGPTQLI